MPEEFLRSYIETALWSSTDDDGEPLDEEYFAEDIAPECLEAMREDCERFWAANAADLDVSNCLQFGPDYGPAERAGHDFWLTRNHHGAGFWDGDWRQPAASRLTEAAHAFGEVNLYVSDGRIYGD